MKKWTLILLLGVSLSACKKEQVDVFVVDPVSVKQSGNKQNLKSDLQFLSIAYTDLFGNQISNRDLQALMAGYNSIGDKQVIIDRIVRKMLTNSGIDRPSSAEMRDDIESFVKASFQRFFVREPSEMEVWYFTSVIEKNPDIQPEEIYYVLMSSEEYRYF